MNTYRIKTADGRTLDVQARTTYEAAAAADLAGFPAALIQRIA